MRYTKPAVVNTLDALSNIESVESTNHNKPISIFVDSVQACTSGAYEADE
jgi:hypothetical protein